ncbi:MAG: hypothetical protein JNK82_19260 [Myxococcaceae bacterium]|nr:hypothetical protein [Myxococcaceae bacterium]
MRAWPLLAAAFFSSLYVLLCGAARLTHLLVMTGGLCSPLRVHAARQLSDEAQATLEAAFVVPRAVEDVTRELWP